MKKSALSITLLLILSTSIVPSHSRAPKISPAFIANILDSAYHNYKLGNYNSAISSYKKALEGDPNNPRIHFELGASYLGEGRYLLAIEHFVTALDLNPALVEAYFSLAFAYQAIAKDKEALKAYRKGLGFDLNKDLPQIKFDSRVEINSGLGLEKENNTSEQIEESDKETVENNDGRASTLAIVPTPIFEEIYRSEESLQEIKLPSSEEDYYYKQIVEYNSELKKHPDDYQLKYRLGILYTKVDLFDPAYKLYKEVAAEDQELAQDLKNRIEEGEKRLSSKLNVDNESNSSNKEKEISIKKEKS